MEAGEGRDEEEGAGEDAGDVREASWGGGGGLEGSGGVRVRARCIDGSQGVFAGEVWSITSPEYKHPPAVRFGQKATPYNQLGPGCFDILLVERMFKQLYIAQRGKTMFDSRG